MKTLILQLAKQYQKDNKLNTLDNESIDLMCKSIKNKLRLEKGLISLDDYEVLESNPGIEPKLKKISDCLDYEYKSYKKLLRLYKELEVLSEEGRSHWFIDNVFEVKTGLEFTVFIGDIVN